MDNRGVPPPHVTASAVTALVVLASFLRVFCSLPPHEGFDIFDTRVGGSERTATTKYDDVQTYCTKKKTRKKTLTQADDRGGIEVAFLLQSNIRLNVTMCFYKLYGVIFVS